MHHWLDHRLPGTGRFGRRTIILLHTGSIWIIIGWLNIVSLPMRRFSQPGDALEILDKPQWGYIWLIGGILAVVNAPLRKTWNGRDVLGFLGLITPSVFWFICFMWSAIAFVATHGQAGNPRAAIGLAVYYLLSVFVLVVAGWPDPDDPAIAARPRQHDYGEGSE